MQTAYFCIMDQNEVMRKPFDFSCVAFIELNDHVVLFSSPKVDQMIDL